jgi:Domain of unknown function (DUF4190)
MSMVPPGDAGSAVYASGYSPGPVPGLPTSPDDKYAPGRIDSRARNAVILGLLAIPLSILTGIPAIVVGAHALRRIKASDGTLKGRAAAWCGIVLGCLSVAGFAVLLSRTYL